MAVVSKAAADKDDERVNRSAVVVDCLGEAGRGIVFQFDEAAETGSHRDAVFQEDSVEGDGTDGTETDHIGWDDDVADLVAGVDKRDEIPHSVSLCEDGVNFGESGAQLLRGTEGGVHHDCSLAFFEVEVHSIGHGVDFRRKKSDSLDGSGALEFVATEKGEKVSAAAERFDDALASEGDQIVADGSFGDIETAGDEFGGELGTGKGGRVVAERLENFQAAAGKFRDIHEMSSERTESATSRPREVKAKESGEGE